MKITSYLAWADFEHGYGIFKVTVTNGRISRGPVIRYKADEREAARIVEAANCH